MLSPFLCLLKLVSVVLLSYSTIRDRFGRL